MKRNEKIFKSLNRYVLKNDFLDKSMDEYLYASISQPPIRIISRNDSDNELEYTVECPNCGNNVNYGRHTYMLSGYIYCDNKGCKDSLMSKLEGM